MTWNNRASVGKQRHYDGPLTGQRARQGRERQPSVCARSIWMTLYFHLTFFLAYIHVFVLHKFRLNFALVSFEDELQYYLNDRRTNLTGECVEDACRSTHSRVKSVLLSISNILIRRQIYHYITNITKVPTFALQDWLCYYCNVVRVLNQSLATTALETLEVGQ